MDHEGTEVVVELVRNPGVQMFGNTPVFGCGENAALRTGLVLPGDLK